VPERKTWKRELAGRLGTLPALKMVSTTLGIAGFFYAYFWVMRHPFSAVTVMPLTWIDELVPFQPRSFLLYASLWLYISLGTALARDLRELAAFGAGSLAMTVVGLCIFVLAPTQIPDFPVDWNQHPSLMFLKTIDATGNACPSLHAAFAVFTAFAIHRQLSASHADRALLVGNVLWCLGILYSTMALRQHVALDVLAGAVLGGPASVLYAGASGGSGENGPRLAEAVGDRGQGLEAGSATAMEERP